MDEKKLKTWIQNHLRWLNLHAENLCWCYKLPDAFSNEICGGIDQVCCVIEWKSLGIWFWENCRNPECIM